MCESCTKDDLFARIEELIASGKYNGAVFAALESHGYEVIRDPILGVGVQFRDQGEKTICYHPKLMESSTTKTADP